MAYAHISGSCCKFFKPIGSGKSGEMGKIQNQSKTSLTGKLSPIVNPLRASGGVRLMELVYSYRIFYQINKDSTLHDL